MTTKQEIAELKETIRLLIERIEQLEARPQMIFPYVPPQLPEPIYYPPQPLPVSPYPVYPYTVPSTARPYWVGHPVTVCINE